MKNLTGFVQNKTNSFAVILAFVVLFIIGSALLPLLKVRLNPSHNAPEIRVSYYWPKASGRVLENEVTSRLEGVFASIKGVQEIKSSSTARGGNISLKFDKHTDLDYSRFEVSSLIQQVYPDLPEGVSYPQINVQTEENDKELLLSYNINGSSSSWEIQKFAEDHLLPKLSQVSGVNGLEVYGASPFEWLINIDVDKLHHLCLTFEKLEKSIRTYFMKKELGAASFSRGKSSKSSVLQIYFSSEKASSLLNQEIPIAKVNGQIIYLNQIAKINYQEKRASRYFRINGLNAINLLVYAEKGGNHLEIARNFKTRLTELQTYFPAGYSIVKSSDSTVYIKEELTKIAWRSGISILILFLFVLIVSRQVRYLILIFASLLSSLSISVIFYYWLGLEIHFYAMAGITVSLGMILDNSIVMIDHIRVQGNRKAFVALLAATLSTIGSLSIIFFLGEEQRLLLLDFALVMIVNLLVSLLVALFLIPALLERFPLMKQKGCFALRRNRRIVRFNRIYIESIVFMKRFKWAFVLILILAFGLPVQYLPEKIEVEKEDSNFAIEIYNSTLGSDWYRESIRSSANIYLGGCLRLFTDYVFENSTYSEPQRVRLYMRGKMPLGGTLEQLNESMKYMENYLSQFDEIEQFKTRVTNPQSGQITISFTKEAGESSFPYLLKNKLTSYAISRGGMDWGVYGVGRGFSNDLNTEYRNSKIEIFGYNYEQLYRIAESVKKDLLQNPRIKVVDIEGRNSWYSGLRHEYFFKSNPEYLASKNLNLGSVYGGLKSVLASSNQSVMFDKQLQPLRLVSNKKDDFDLWQLKNTPLQWQQREFKLQGISRISKEKSGNNIYKRNQEYQLVVAYDFIGPDGLRKRILKKGIEDLKPTLPLGYRVREPSNIYWWNTETKQSYSLLLLVILIIYFICAILLESLWQPLSVIAMIPISYIGVFLTFYLFDLNFDQGGYAAFVLLAGVSVNAALYLINDFNHLKRNKVMQLSCYIKAYNHKIIPILLTIISTILGMIPFLIAGKNESFWFALAAGTIGGLLFSIFAIVFYLPLFIRLSKE